MNAESSGERRVVAVSGSLHHPSSTRVVLDAVLAGLGASDAPVLEVTRLDGLATAFGRGPLPSAVQGAIDAITDADLLVVGTPVYRGSYTGLLKHFVDLVPQQALAGTSALLVAVGGSDEHSLVIEHELRPLFGFFGAHTLPVGVYARGSDIAAGEVASDALRERIAAAVAGAERWA